jgi:hypothetical protein
MPAAPIAKGLGAAGLGASGASGKKASNAGNQLAQQQLQLQQNQFGLTKQQYGLGNAALGPASNWYQDLLKGGQAAVQATGPYASLIGQSAEGNRNAIMAATPRGGEQNLAIAQNYNQAGNNIARLYAGMQPLAAQGLTQVGGAYLGSGSAVNPQASPYAAASIYQSQLQNAQQGAQGFGSLLYNAMRKGGSGGGKDNGSLLQPGTPGVSG